MEFAAREKHTRYGATVRTIAMGTFGRLGSEGREALQEVARAAASARALQEAPGALAGRWRAAMERAVLWAKADVAHLAFGGAHHAPLGEGGRDAFPLRP